MNRVARAVCRLALRPGLPEKGDGPIVAPLRAKQASVVIQIDHEVRMLLAEHVRNRNRPGETAE